MFLPPYCCYQLVTVVSEECYDLAKKIKQVIEELQSVCHLFSMQ